MTDYLSSTSSDSTITVPAAAVATVIQNFAWGSFDPATQSAPLSGFVKTTSGGAVPDGCNVNLYIGVEIPGSPTIVVYTQGGTGYFTANVDLSGARGSIIRARAVFPAQSK